MDNKTQITINQDTQSHPCKERQRLDSSQEETLKHILREEYDPIYSIYGKASIHKSTSQHSNLTLAENKKRNKVSKTLEVITKPHFQNQHTKRQLFDTLINYWKNQIATFSEAILTLKETIRSIPQKQADLKYEKAESSVDIPISEYMFKNERKKPTDDYNPSVLRQI